MKCLEFRRALLAGQTETEAMRDHRRECPGCDGFLREHEAFERELRRALEVQVPAGLERRLAEAIGADDMPRRADRRRLLAAAAAVVAAAGVGLYATIERDDPLALACISWVMKEEVKSIMMGSMSREDAARALAATLPLEQVERIGRVRHVAPCPFNGGTAYHVVLDVPQEKVTLLVMPGARLPGRRTAVHDGVHAAVVPLANGAVGIVASSRAVVASVAGALRGA